MTMGTSTHQHPPSGTAGIAVAEHHQSAPAPSASSSSFNRRDSCSGGINFVQTNTNNVIVRGPSPTSGHSKKEGQDQKTEHDSALAMSLSDFSVGSIVNNVKACDDDDVKDILEAIDAAPSSSSSSSSAMDVDEMCGVCACDDDDDDDDYSAATTHGYTSSEEDETLSGPSSDVSFPTFQQAQHQQQQHQEATWSVDNDKASLHSAASSAAASASAFRHYATPSPSSAAATSSASSASSSTAMAQQQQQQHQNQKALQSMQRILNLNQSAINHYLTGGDDDWALDALHKAEWVRCHLVDELEVLHSHQSHHEDTDEAIRKNMFLGVKKQGHSSSFTSGREITSSSQQQQSDRQPKYMRRTGSFSHGDVQQQLLQPQPQSQSQSQQHPSSVPDNVVRSSYIYQRMDFDEGMHSFINLESINPASFWLMADNWANPTANITRMYEISPVVEATLVFNVGQVHRRKGELDVASQCYERSLDILQNGSGSGTTGSSTSSLDLLSSGVHNPMMALHQGLRLHPIIIPILHNIGQLQYRRGEIAQATETYTSALRHAQMMYGGRHPHVASALNCLGVLHYHDANSSSEDETEVYSTSMAGQAREDSNDEVKSDNNSNDNNDNDNISNSNQTMEEEQHTSTQKAMELFQQALSIRLEILGPNHVDVATVLNNIGRIHVQLDEFDQALNYYEDALRIRRTVLGADSLDYAATAFNAGQSFHQKGELTRAAELYHEFLRVALVKFGHSHRDVAVVLSGIAQIHQEKREYDKALELYEASLCAGRAALGENHSEIAMLLNRMGNFHFEQERLDDALRCYRRGLRIERKVLPADHPNIVVTLSNLGEIHRQRSEWDDAAKMYGDCLDILRKKHDGKDHIDIASTLSTIGLIHDQRGDTCLSLHYLQDALLMRRRLMGNDHLDVSATLVYIGTILYRKSVFSVAIELFTESLRIRKAALGKDHRDVAFVLYNIALVHQQRGCYEEAIESYSETLRIEKLVLGDRHRDVSMTLFKLGEVNKAAGDLDAALRCFEESLAVEKGLSANNNAAPSADATTQRRQQQSVGPDHAAMARALNEIGNIHLTRGDAVPMMDAFNEASRLYRAAGLNPNNVVVSGHLYALDFSCPEAAPAA